jgi:hypothetical protein
VLGRSDAKGAPKLMMVVGLDHQLHKHRALRIISSIAALVVCLRQKATASLARPVCDSRNDPGEYADTQLPPLHSTRVLAVTQYFERMHAYVPSPD